MCKIKEGKQKTLFLSNLNAKRDWGHARDYCVAMWKMLQQKQPEDFVIATGVQYSVRQFIQWSAKELGITLSFEGEGLNEIGIVESKEGNHSPNVNVGDVIVRIDKRYFRPAEVDTLLGDPSKAREQLGWTPEITVQEMCSEMIAEDLKIAKQTRLIKDHES